MLYSIIPPIILVLALIGIIVMLMKKASQVALIRDDARMDDGRSGTLKMDNSSGQTLPAEKKGTGAGVKNSLLIFLEKIIRKFRVLVLKLENVFHFWGESIRNKRKDMKEVKAPQSSEAEKEDDLMEKLRSYEPGQAREESRRKISIKGDASLTSEEKTVKPMISERVVTPIPRSEVKDQLEKLLIERIAANPKDVEAYERLGEYYFEIGSYEYAKECFKQIIKLNPGNANVKNKMRKLERLLMR